MDQRLEEAHVVLKRRGWVLVLGGIALWLVVALATLPSAARYLFGTAAAFAVLIGLGHFAQVANERRWDAQRAKREADWMAGRVRIERAVKDRPGMTLADVEALLAEARRAGATDEDVVRATSFLKGDGIERLWIDVQREPRPPSESA